MSAFLTSNKFSIQTYKDKSVSAVLILLTLYSKSPHSFDAIHCRKTTYNAHFRLKAAERNRAQSIYPYMTFDPPAPPICDLEFFSVFYRPRVAYCRGSYEHLDRNHGHGGSPHGSHYFRRRGLQPPRRPPQQLRQRLRTDRAAAQAPL